VRYNKRMTKLDTEIATYQGQRAKLVDEHNGEYVLIKGDNVVGFYKTEAEALSVGYEKFLNEPFLVRSISEAETPVFFTSLFVGRQCPT
jgi:hypothetical protein